MIYAYDRAINLPVQDLYDTQLMTTQINAARELYNQAQEKQDQFYKEYGDFLSPSEIDTENYYNLGINRIKQGIDDMYKQGIDPLRNPEGRSRLRSLINNVPYADLQKLKYSAKAQEDYNNSVRQLKANGLYSKEFEDLEGGGPENYDTLKNGIWNRQSPTPYKSMAQLSEDYYNDIKPGIIEEGVDKHTGVRYQLLGISKKNIEDVAEQKALDIINTPQGQLIYKGLLNKNNQDSNLAMRDFKDMIIAANINRTMNPTKIVDPLWAEKQNINYNNARLALERAKFAFQRQQAARAGSQDYELKRNIFQEARFNGKGGDAKYNPYNASALRIAPNSPSVGVMDIDNVGQVYTISNIGGAQVYSQKDVYSRNRERRVYKLYDSDGNQISNADLRNGILAFVPNGNLHAKQYKNGNLSYTVGGRVAFMNNTIDEATGKPNTSFTYLYVKDLKGNLSQNASMLIKDAGTYLAPGYEYKKEQR